MGAKLPSIGLVANGRVGFEAAFLMVFASPPDCVGDFETRWVGR